MSAHTAQTELKLIGKLILEGTLHCETGLHVGAGKGSLEIGGADNPVVKDAFGRPYIPGSSLRGRIRALLEQATGMAVPSEMVFVSRRKGQEVRIHQSDRPDDEICLLFGRTPGRMERVSGDALEGGSSSPARLAVFDAALDLESITPQMRENLDDELTEVKSENAIDRITSQANARTFERVPVGARFRTRFVLDILCEEDAPLLGLFVQGLRLLEDDALGGGGSRGSGRVRFSDLKLMWRDKGYYSTGNAEQELAAAAGLSELQSAVHEKGSALPLGVVDTLMASVQSASTARPGLLVKLRPSRPWRIGPASAARDSVDLIYHSDTLYSALTQAMRLLGKLEFWLESTARAEGGSPIRFTSLYPFFGDTLYVPPPRHIWPPAPSVRVRYSGARFVPASLVESMFAGHPLQDERWSVDGVSECLVPSGRSGPFRTSVRSSAAVDRITGSSEPHHTACLEFAPKSGLWFAIGFADAYMRDQWSDSLRGAVRLLADSGFGGERSRGWGRAHSPEFRDGVLPQLIYKGLPSAESVAWTLSLISPADSDQVDWEKGSYSATVRGGRIDSPTTGSGAAKKLLTMIEEGSVLSATTLEGSAPDVAPEGFPHPVYHAGWAFVISVPAEVPRQLDVVAAAIPTPAPIDEPGEPLPMPIEPNPNPESGPVDDEPDEPALPPNDPDPELPPVGEPEPDVFEGPFE